MNNTVNIKVIGVGGAGNSVVDRMIEASVQGVSYVDINTDANAIKESQAQEKLQIGENLTNGLGTGSNVEMGRKAAEDATAKIEAILKGTDMVFITAGLGGGCGTGAAPVVARVAKTMGILTVAVVTKPFFFEGRRHMRVAEVGIAELRKCTDSIIVIPNNNLKNATDSKITFINAFAIADSILVETVVNIIDLIQSQAQINVDFADVTTVLQDSGTMHVGICRAGGVGRAETIYDSICQSRLLDTTINDAQKVLLCITASTRVGLDEIENLSEAVRNAVHPDANIIIGLRLDERMGDDMQAMIIATAITEAGNWYSTIQGIFPLLDTSDFYISQGEHTAWLEHYALSKSGYNSLFTPRQTAKYKKAIRDKRDVHARFGTKLLETWSLYNDHQPLLVHLREALEKEGFALQSRNLDEVYRKIVDTGKDTHRICSDYDEIYLNWDKELSDGDTLVISNNFSPPPYKREKTTTPKQPLQKFSSVFRSSADSFDSFKKRIFSVSLYQHEYDVSVETIKEYRYKRTEFIMASANTATKGSM